MAPHPEPVQRSGTKFSPGRRESLIIGSVLVVASLVLIRDAVGLGRDLRREPLDFAFEPAPSRGLLSPGTVFGLAGGVGMRPANAPRK